MPTLLEFVRKWNASQLTERSASQQHFSDLCDALAVPHPTDADEIGHNYAFDKRVTKLSGGEGFADVWKRGFLPGSTPLKVGPEGGRRPVSLQVGLQSGKCCRLK